MALFNKLRMPRLLLPAAFFLAVIGCPRASSALVINEVMYDAAGLDAGHEWVEVWNDGAEPVTVATGTLGWRFYDGASHLIHAPVQGSLAISPGAYAIFADNAATFLGDHPAFTGTVFDTVASLPNSTGTVRLIDQKNGVQASLTYVSFWGAKGNGKTLERAASGSWHESASVGGTPGEANSVPLPSSSPSPSLLLTPRPTSAPKKNIAIASGSKQTPLVPVEVESATTSANSPVLISTSSPGESSSSITRIIGLAADDSPTFLRQYGLWLFLLFDAVAAFLIIAWRRNRMRQAPMGSAESSHPW